ncbi:MAG TPA: AtpZ/AtpI family protein [Bacteroidota bacterium]
MTGSSKPDEQHNGSPPESSAPQSGRRVRALNTFYQEFGPFLTLGIQLAVAVVVFYFIGAWVDERYNTSPTFTLVGVMLGTVGGLVKFFKSVSDLNKKEESQKDEQRP